MLKKEKKEKEKNNDMVIKYWQLSYGNLCCSVFCKSFVWSDFFCN